MGLKRYSSRFVNLLYEVFNVKLLKISALLGVVSVLGACSSTPLSSEASKAAVAPSVAVINDAAAPAQTTSQVASVVVPAHLDPKNPIAASRSVYFGFDEFAIQSNQFAVVERHGAYLKAHPELKVAVEGNTDEQGSAEYNLALGQKRAEAVVKALTSTYGVNPGQLEAVSWGREKPKAMGHNEAAWAQNRRADIQYLSK